MVIYYIYNEGSTLASEYKMFLIEVLQNEMFTCIHLCFDFDKLRLYFSYFGEYFSQGVQEVHA